MRVSEEEPKVPLARVIEQLRETLRPRGITLLDLCANAGIGTSTVEDILTGTTTRPRKSTVNLLVKGTEVTLANAGFSPEEIGRWTSALRQGYAYTHELAQRAKEQKPRREHEAAPRIVPVLSPTARAWRTPPGDAPLVSDERLTPIPEQEPHGSQAALVDEAPDAPASASTFVPGHDAPAEQACTLPTSMSSEIAPTAPREPSANSSPQAEELDQGEASQRDAAGAPRSEASSEADAVFPARTSEETSAPPDVLHERMIEPSPPIGKPADDEEPHPPAASQTSMPTGEVEPSAASTRTHEPPSGHLPAAAPAPEASGRPSPTATALAEHMPEPAVAAHGQEEPRQERSTGSQQPGQTGAQPSSPPAAAQPGARRRWARPRIVAATLSVLLAALLVIALLNHLGMIRQAGPQPVAHWSTGPITGILVGLPALPAGTAPHLVAADANTGQSVSLPLPGPSGVGWQPVALAASQAPHQVAVLWRAADVGQVWIYRLQLVAGQAPTLAPRPSPLGLPTNCGEGCTSLTFTSDGHGIILDAQSAHGTALLLLNLATQVSQWLTPGPKDSQPSCSPDGRYLQWVHIYDNGQQAITGDDATNCIPWPTDDIEEVNGNHVWGSSQPAVSPHQISSYTVPIANSDRTQIGYIGEYALIYTLSPADQSCQNGIWASENSGPPDVLIYTCTYPSHHLYAGGFSAQPIEASRVEPLASGRLDRLNASTWCFLPF